MSGDIQPRKKKKTTKRKQPVVIQSPVDVVEEPVEVKPPKKVEQEVEVGSVNDDVEEEGGGGLCSRVVFFVLLMCFLGTGTLVACDYQSGQVSSLLGKEAVWPNFQGIYLPQGLQMPNMDGLRGLMPSWGMWRGWEGWQANILKIQWVDSTLLHPVSLLSRW